MAFVSQGLDTVNFIRLLKIEDLKSLDIISYESAKIMYKNSNITKSFDIETFVLVLPELVAFNKTIPE